MIIKETGIAGLILLEPEIYKDQRGYFFESYHNQRMGLGIEFIQDNQSRSHRNVIRGLHYQKDPYAQIKLVRVVEGSIFDVAIDLRAGSSTFGHWYGIELNVENHLQLLIPKGFAHGFSVLSAYATVLYKCDAYYHPEAEAGIHFNDPDLNIDWLIEPGEEIVSEKDRMLPYFKELSTP